MLAVLDGVKALDLTSKVSGPYCSMLLADLGADVIKIERPDGGDSSRLVSPLYLGINRNKRSLAIDLKLQRGKDIFYELTKNTDVILEGFRPGVASRLGIDYQSLRRINPKLIYCSISGYGQDGPYANMPGHDINYSGISGLCGLSENVKSKAELPAIAYADIAGSMFALVSILSSLSMRVKTKKGQFIDVSMTDCLFSWMSTSLRLVMHSQNSKANVFPHYGVFKAKDDKFFTLGIISEEHFWKNLCGALNICELENLTILDRQTISEKIFDLLSRIFLTRTRDEWIERLRDAKVPCGPVHTPMESLDDPQLVHREMVYEIEHSPDVKLKQRSFPVKFSENHLKKDMPPPSLGQHTREIMRDLGYGGKEINELEELSIIRS